MNVRTFANEGENSVPQLFPQFVRHLPHDMGIMVGVKGQFLNPFGRGILRGCSRPERNLLHSRHYL